MSGTPIRLSPTAAWRRGRARRLPEALELLAAALLLAAVAVAGELGTGTVLTPLVLLPVLFFALRDARLELALTSVAAALVATLPAFSEPRIEAGAALAEGAVWLAALTAAGFSIAGLVRRRSAAIERFAMLASTDPLTGLANRRAWGEALRREIARAEREGLGFSVALVDIDRFKAFNDRYGHGAGDRLLKEAGSRWLGQIRAMDVLARHGGEEFALLLPRAEGADAVAVAERLRRSTPESVTVSVGVAEWNGPEHPEALVARADAALYAAKRDGRDRVRLAQRSATSRV